MATFSNESLDQLYKKDLIPIVLSLQNKLDEASNSKTELLDEIRRLNDKFDKLQSDACITKNANSQLSSRPADIERQCWANARYSRRKCLDIVGTPNEVKDETLEESDVGILDKVGCSIDTDRIEACHRASENNNTVIVKFTRRKVCQKIWNKKKELKNHKMEDFGLPGQGKIFTNSSLSPYYRMLWSKSKKILTLGKIYSFHISNGTIRIKISENSSPLSITHVDDFGKHFPDID